MSKFHAQHFDLGCGCWAQLLLAACLGCTAPPVARDPPPPRPVAGLTCLSPTDPASVAAALRDELLRQRGEHPSLAGLTSALMPTDSLWLIAYGEQEVPNPGYEEQLRAYEAEARRRDLERAKGKVKHWHAIYPPSKTRKVLGPDGLRLHCDFEVKDPRINWSRSEAVVTLHPVEGGEVAELHEVSSPYFGDWFVRIGDTFVVYETSETEVVTASLLTLAQRVAACP